MRQSDLIEVYAAVEVGELQLDAPAVMIEGELE